MTLFQIGFSLLKIQKLNYSNNFGLDERIYISYTYYRYIKLQTALHILKLIFVPFYLINDSSGQEECLLLCLSLIWRKDKAT